MKIGTKMKKHILILWAALWMTGGFTACTDNDSPMNEKSGATTATIRATIDGDLGSRVTLTDDADNRVVKVDWKAGDDFKITVNGEDYTFIYNTESREFEYTGTDFPETFTEAGSVIATYPATTPTAYASQPGTLEGAASLLTMTATLDVEAGQSTAGLDLTFTHTTSIVKMTLTHTAFESSFVTVSLNAEGLLSDGTAITTSASIETKANGKATVYFAVPPTSGELSDVFILVSRKGTHYTTTMTNAKKIEAGKLYNINKNDLTENTDGYVKSGSTYTVFTAEGLTAWNTAVASDLSLCLTLAEDITLPTDNITVDADGVPSGSNWTVFGTYNDPYTGTIDGAGHSITGLRINSDASYVGLVGYAKKAVIKNLRLVKPAVYGSSGTVGAISGFLNDATSAIIDCEVENGTVTGAGNNVGGIVGGATSTPSITHCTVTNCAVKGTKTGTYVGGIVGFTSGLKIQACMFLDGSVTGTGTVGGIAGGSSLGLKMLACGNTGTVSGGTSVGGIVGNYSVNASASSISIVMSCWTKKDGISESDGGSDGIGNGNDALAAAYCGNCYAGTQYDLNYSYLEAMNNGLSSTNAAGFTTDYRWQAGANIESDWPTLVKE